jgi:hypothetical protein
MHPWSSSINSGGGGAVVVVGGSSLISCGFGLLVSFLVPPHSTVTWHPLISHINNTCTTIANATIATVVAVLQQSPSAVSRLQHSGPVR